MDNLLTINRIVDLISKKDPFQRKSLKKYLESCNKYFLEKSEWYLKNYISFLQTKNIDLEFIVDSYLLMVKDILIEQTRFLKTGRYRYDNLKSVYERIYSNKEYMFRYMIGVALSQFLWKNHRDMFLFFKKNIKMVKGENYLEVGPGHGLFYMEALSTNNFNNYHAVDISKTSIEMTKNFIDYCLVKSNADIKFILGDINEIEINNRYNFITMGEVLEHVENPKKLLKSIYSLLNQKGKTFLSTCANAPVIDHIYLYNSIDEIKNDILDACLTIIDEIVICNDNIDEKEWVEKKANLSYACIAEKRE